MSLGKSKKKVQVSGTIDEDVRNRILELADNTYEGNFSMALNVELKRLYRLDEEKKNPKKQVKY